MIWVLILFAHAGAISDSDSMSLTNVPGFKTQAACQAAGEQAKKMQYGTTKVLKYTCVEVER